MDFFKKTLFIFLLSLSSVNSLLYCMDIQKDHLEVGVQLVVGPHQKYLQLDNSYLGNGKRFFPISAAFNSDGTMLLIGALYGIYMCDPRTGKCLGSIHESSALGEPVVAFSPDERKIFITGSNQATLLDSKTGEKLAFFVGHRYEILSAAFSRDGKKLLTGSRDRTAILWNSNTAEILQRFEGHSSACTSVALSSDGKKAFTGCYWEGVRWWDTETGELLGKIVFEDCSVLGISPQGKIAFVYFPHRKTAELWDLKTEKLLLELPKSFEYVRAIQFSSDGKKIVVAEAQSASLWNIKAGVLLAHLEGHEAVKAVALSASGTMIFTASLMYSGRIWDLSFLTGDSKQPSSELSSMREDENSLDNETNELPCCIA